MTAIIGIGMDIVDIARLRNARHLLRIAEFLLVEEELKAMKASRDPAQFVASRLALKEAVIKAFPGELCYHDLITGKRGVAPAVRFVRTEDQKYHAYVSIAHELRYAVGCATLFL